MPFTSSSKTTTPTPSVTPGNSYSGGGGYTISQSYGGAQTSYASGSGRSREDLHTYGRSHSTYGQTGGMDRPLPPRNGPGYGHRPKSIDLVTPTSAAI